MELTPNTESVVVRRVKFADLSDGKHIDTPAATRKTETKQQKKQLNRFASMEEAKADTMEALKSVSRDRFKSWAKFELVELFVVLGIELRNEKNIPREHLKQLATSV